MKKSALYVHSSTVCEKFRLGDSGCPVAAVANRHMMNVLLEGDNTIIVLCSLYDHL